MLFKVYITDETGTYATFIQARSTAECLRVIRAYFKSAVKKELIQIK